jgi:acetyltransferase-like isoleucine patch superfamily enzyme
MLESLLRKFVDYRNTCSIKNIKDGGLAFARDEKYLKYLDDVDKDCWVIVPKGTKFKTHPNVKLYKTEFPEYTFTCIHNYIYALCPPTPPKIGDQCVIHDTAILDVDGLKVVNTPNGEKIQFKHTGGVIIQDDVEIGPYTVVHRGTLENTIIRAGCKIGAHNNIGHNCDIGLDTVIAAGVIINGGVKIGESCWISSGVMIKHYVNICHNVVIGLGSVVTKDITESGIYVGNPARFLKPIEEGWNF